MKRFIWVILFVLISNLLYAHDSTAIHFEHGLTWAQIIREAKTQNRYIFLDFFTTWCAPCKRMEKEVYPDADVANYTNEKFISVKVQLDTSKADNDETRSWYGQAAELAREYNIQSYPTFLFFSPDGEIVHKGIGFMPSKGFLTLLKDAADTSRQYYTNLKKFRSGVLRSQVMPSLISALMRNGEAVAANEVGEFYVDSVLLKLSKDSLFTKRNIGIMQAITRNVNSSSFRWIFTNADKIDSIMGANYSSSIIGIRILNDEVKPVLAKWDSLRVTVVTRRRWSTLQRNIARRYNRYYAQKTVLNGQLQWYGAKKDWEQLVALNVKKINDYGMDTSSILDITRVNNVIYYTIFMHSVDKKILTKSISWMKLICEAKPNEPDFLDTYANLFYKLGEVDKALAIEQRAFSMSAKRSNAKEFVETLDKMKQGQPTWPLN